MQYFDPRHPVLANGGWSGLDGTKCRGSPDSCNILADDNPEEERLRLGALRARLQDAIGDGDPLGLGVKDTPTILLDLFGGRITAGDIADQARTHRTTISRRIKKFLAEIKKIVPVAEAVLDVLATGSNRCTISPATAQSVVGIDRWAVSLSGLEERCPEPTFRALCAYIRQNRSLLLEADDLYLSVRFDEKDGQWCTEVIKLLPDMAAAVAFAHINGQKCITYLLTSEVAQVRVAESL